MSSMSSNSDLFEYTSGRFLFNEKLRRAERCIQFDVDALVRAACHSVGRRLDGVASITKLAEGGFNRVLQLTFNDGYAVLARLPYKTTIPKHYVVASEAATLTHLRAHGVPAPKVLAYSPDQTNPVRTEYILLERLEGIPLSDQWFSMDTKTRVKIMRQIVNMERRFMSIHFPASGSLYYRRDLDSSQHFIPISDDIVVGPTVQHEWWYQERASLEVDRGPWTTFSAYFEAPAKREIEFYKRFGKPRLHVERYLREIYQFQSLSPILYQYLLANYLKLAPYLDVLSGRMSRPTLRHPDFSPNNILVNMSNDMVGVIDWQHAVILPLCLCAGIPEHFQNWGDPLSETLSKPEVKLPANFDQLSDKEQETVQETMRRRIVHFYYTALTMKSLPDHFDAIRTENYMLRAKLFHHAQAPWEGDSTSLKYVMLQVLKNWPMSLDGGAQTRSAECPIHFSEEEIQKCSADYRQEQEKLRELGEMRDLIGTDALGWVSDEDELERSRAVIQSIKDGLMEYSSTDMEKTAVLSHFPFDDHEEKA
ncbi:hypothetical protein DTO006G1_6644 [Penicillium roqueforti]|uniref:uncharacterized protein n=1 Tax=Penicillium roqueforti TaxID=5082 RepID=UPI00190CB642|nr:uncharacterized protein LCP9604111_4204 [Penicillium roqueforti]KAF9249575.1 hypothetical protein LCP9604111_4204 [Penicillium roqueforti]KAI1835116.1 hypothetical protein CBS147337_3933 [Penicillium roqueforti]KAI2677129.1 hypothetical protein CBS147355_5356 [Penicillium roqueforti]KAI2688573.1 hypothetical protein LCP963914a_2975 [Penicillium roqueforti]KAI2712521.1 hypothetical protein CBS147354_8027 [Penicillium roqueforti]